MIVTECVAQIQPPGFREFSVDVFLDLALRWLSCHRSQMEINEDTPSAHINQAFTLNVERLARCLLYTVLLVRSEFTYFFSSSPRNTVSPSNCLTWNIIDIYVQSII